MWFFRMSSSLKRVTGGRRSGVAEVDFVQKSLFQDEKHEKQTVRGGTGNWDWVMNPGRQKQELKSSQNLVQITI